MILSNIILYHRKEILKGQVNLETICGLKNLKKGQKKKGEMTQRRSTKK